MRYLLLLIFVPTLLLAQKPPRDVAGIQVPSGYKVSGTAAIDVNGDELLDLVVTAVKRGDENDRYLYIYKRREGGGFPAKPDHERFLHKDFTAFLVADVLSSPGLEVVLFSGSRVVAWLPTKTGREQWISLFRCPFVIQLPKSGRMLYLPEFAADLDSDGMMDFVIPLSHGYGVFRQTKPGAFEHKGDLVIPAPKTEEENTQGGSLSVRRRTISVALRVPEFEKARTGRTLRKSLVFTTEWAWQQRITDFDGDGKLDLLVRGSHELYLWKNLTSRSGDAPEKSWEVPVVADRSRLVDIAYSSHFLDLNGDKKTDSVMIAGDQRSDKPRTQIMVFEQGGKKATKESPLFGEKGIPGQLLVLGGFTGATDFQDVDGDGKLDLVMGSLRQDIIDKLRESARKKTEVEFYVFLNRGGSFSKVPDIRKTFEMKLEGLSALKSGFLAKFIPDVTGDGIAELVTRTRPERLDVHYLRKGRSGKVELLDKPLWTVNITRYAELSVLKETSKEKAGVLVIEPDAAVMVRF